MRERRRRKFVRWASGVAAVAVAVAIVNAGTDAFRDGRQDATIIATYESPPAVDTRSAPTSADSRSAGVAARPTADAEDDRRTDAPASPAPDSAARSGRLAVADSADEPSVGDRVIEAPPPAVAEAAPPAMTPRRAIVPVIAEGRTELGDSLFAVRQGTDVTVHFDTYVTRTRRRDKFDRIVRETLPRVYGAQADSVLAGIPAGELIPEADLVEEITTTGIRLALTDGSTLQLWPRTRPGRDGPLVVAYFATITR